VSRTEVAVVALIVLLMAWLLMPPPVAPDAPPASITPVVCKAGDIPACVGTPPPVITATPTGPRGTPVAEVFLPLVERCSECLSAWPVWPGKGE
jgi:hypothetical protein